MSYLQRIALVFIFGMLVWHSSAYSQRAIPNKPSPEKGQQTAVYDYAKLLSTIEVQNLERKLINYADTTSTQIVVATIPSLQGEDIGIYAVQWAQKWGIGQAKEDNGIFILVAKNDRKLWIAPGYGAEIKLTAGINGTIVRNVILPEFKQGKYFAGLDYGTTAIMKVLEGSFQGSRLESGNSDKFPLDLVFIIVVFIIILIIMSKNKRGGGGHGGNRSKADSLLDVIILSNMGRGGFGGSGRFGGGSPGGFGGGFGGGGFSGGGAGGSW